MTEMTECGYKFFKPCGFAAQRDAMMVFKRLLTHSLRDTHCYDLYTFLTFNEVAKRLMRIKKDYVLN